MKKDKIASARGMHDIMPPQMRKHRKIIETSRKVSGFYGCEHIETPIVENSEVFKRSLGDSSDVVNKEMYIFPDRKGRELVLRPENTAGIARALIENGLQESLPARFFYEGVMFRYERPQLGRQRQFHQVGIEILGTNNTGYLTDADVITCAFQFLKELGLDERVSLEINSLGDAESREKYKTALVEYFNKYEKELSADSQVRLKQNPLRILDSKDERDKEIISTAPSLLYYLNDDSKKWFNNVRVVLDNVRIRHNVNTKLVRGLDYYSHTVFEFTTNDLGAHDTVLAGGRYNGLVETLGGRDIDGVGWAAGVERLALMLPEIEAETPVISLVNMNEEDNERLPLIAYRIRTQDIRVDYIYDGNLKKKMQHANDSQAQFALILNYGSNFTLKDMRDGKEFSFPLSIELRDAKWLLRLERVLSKLR